MFGVLHKYNFERLVAYSVLFYAGLVFCLPVPHSDEVAALYPWWAKRIDFSNMVLHEIIFILWAFFLGSGYLRRSLLNPGTPTRNAGIAVLILAIWCGIISIGAPLAIQDIGRTFRLFVIVMIMLGIIRWAIIWGNNVLVSYVMGMLVGAIINLIISYMYPLVVYEMMRLSGQNTPGVAMGIAIHLCAWLFYRCNNSIFRFFALLSSLVFIFGCALSYSRIGWFSGFAGIIAWCFVLFLAKPYAQKSRAAGLRASTRKYSVGTVIVVVAFLFSNIAQDGIEYLGALFDQKISQQSESDGARWGYLKGAIEILGDHPLGVGYSGFYDAQISTEVYKRGEAIEEDDPASANPHASFLWYLIAGGIPAGMLSVFAFVAFQKSLLVGFKRDMGRSGFVFFGLVSPCFFLIAMTVPYIFNSVIMIAPVAIVAGWGWQRRFNESLRHSI